MPNKILLFSLISSCIIMLLNKFLGVIVVNVYNKICEKLSFNFPKFLKYMSFENIEIEVSFSKVETSILYILIIFETLYTLPKYLFHGFITLKVSSNIDTDNMSPNVNVGISRGVL